MTAEATAERRRGGASERGKQFWTVENLTSAPFLLVVATVLLCVFGLVMVFSASSIESVEAGGKAWDEFAHQAVFMALSAGACLIVRGVGGRFWVERAFYVLWGITVLMLIAVQLLGDESHGATRWLYIGPISLQPSEFAKITLIMAAARLLAGWERGEFTLLRLAIRFALFIAIPMGLILIQKDLGTLLILAAAMFLMLILAGVSTTVLVGIVVVGVVLVILLILSSGYRLARFTIYLDPYSDYYGDGWQLIHGLYAFASGGFFGVGLGNSRQKYSYLPEAENDFIFAIIGEELGFLGGLFVVALFVLFGVSGMRIAYQARDRDRVSSLMASGLTVLVLVQALLNMGGVLQLLPLSGRPLPFISSGGSSIMANLIIVGLLLGVARDNECEALTQRGNARRASARQLTVVEGGPARRESTRRTTERAASSTRRVRPSAEERPQSQGFLDPDHSREKGRR